MAITNNLIGVSICTAGNICVSLALNIQKLAHQRLHPSTSSDDESPNPVQAPSTSKPKSQLVKARRQSAPPNPSSPSPANESTPLIDVSYASPDGSTYDTSSNTAPGSVRSTTIDSQPSGPAITSSRNDSIFGHLSSSPVDSRHTEGGHRPSFHQNHAYQHHSPDKPTYLSSKLWWTGLAVMALGETGNFLSYGFAPASVVAPLGNVALVSNCIFAPLLLKERFRKRDLVGIVMCLLGAVTVVYSAKSPNVPLYPHELLEHITQTAFLVYSCICIAFAILLGFLSRTKYGDRYVAIDVGLCAILGAYTVLSTKAIASLLNLLFLKSFKYWITYPTLAVLLFTAVTQVAYLNKALQRFDSKIIVPTQYVFFTISAIVGSAVLYREFERTDFDSALNFFLGCLTVFVGVYILTTLSKTTSGEGPSSSSLKAAAAGPHKTPSRVTSVSFETPKKVNDRFENRTIAISTPPRTTTFHPRSETSTPLSIPAIARQRSLSVLGSGVGPRSAGYLLIANSPRGSENMVVTDAGNLSTSDDEHEIENEDTERNHRISENQLQSDTSRENVVDNEHDYGV